MSSSTSAGRRMRMRMRVGRNERLHKIFIIHDRPASKGAAPAGEFRVFTKEKLDGTLELLGYHYLFDGEHEHQSNVLRAPSVPVRQLVPIIRNLVTQTHTDIQQMQVVDLTTLRTRLDQADRLAQNELLDAFDFE
jgi:hypothetical protein